MDETIVLLHGFSGTHRTWDGIVALLEAERYRPLALDPRGLGTGVMEPLWGRLGALSMPVTLVAGERDAKYRDLAERLRAGLPDARVAVVPGAGHAVHLEAPGSVVGLITER